MYDKWGVTDPSYYYKKPAAMAQPLYTTSINKRTVFVSQGGRADLVFLLPLQDMYKVKDEDRSSKNINEEEKKPTGYGNTPTQYSQSTVQR